MKNKFILTIASILSVVAIIGVGFAAWVIMNPNVEEIAQGSITVEEVTDKSYTLTAEITKDNIVFGKPETLSTDISNPWLTPDSKTQNANLTATVKLTLKYEDKTVLPENFKVKFEALKKGEGDATVAASEFWTAVDTATVDGLLAAPKINEKEVTSQGATVEIPQTSFSDNSAEKTMTLSFTVEFNWGKKFGGENPYNYYNKLAYKDYKDTALTDLKALAELSGVSYKLTISGTSKTQG